MPKACIYAGFRHLFYQMALGLALFVGGVMGKSLLQILTKRRKDVDNSVARKMRIRFHLTGTIGTNYGNSDHSLPHCVR